MGLNRLKTVLQQKTKEGNQFKLPLVDFSSFSNPADLPVSIQQEEDMNNATNGNLSAAQRQAAKELNEANRGHGFVCLRNSGVPKSVVRSAFDASKHLFALGDEAKKKLKQIDPETNTGYVGYGKESLNRNRRTDLKEAFNIRHTSGGGICEDTGDLVGTPPDFERDVKTLWNELNKLGSRYAVSCAISLGLEQDYFSKTLDTMDLCTMRMLHYPPCESNPNLDSSCAIRVGEHTDFGAFTFLFVDDFHDESSLGLQVKAVEGGGSEVNVSANGQQGVMDSWNDVIFDQESLEIIDKDETSPVIVNTGALMARWTNDLWRATAHRVVVTPSSYASHRYSIAMFFDPDKETVCSVHPKFVNNGDEPKYPPIKSIDYLMMKLKEAQGVG